MAWDAAQRAERAERLAGTRPPGSWNHTLPVRDRLDPRYYTPDNQHMLREMDNGRASKPDE